MNQLPLETLKKYAADYPIVPVYKEIFSDTRTVVSVLKALKRVSKTAFLLESADNKENWGRYSFLGYNPLLEITCKAGTMTIKGATTQTYRTTKPNEEIRRVMKEYRSPQFDFLPTFTGGLVGYFGYEYMTYQEPHLDHGFQAQRMKLMSTGPYDIPIFNDVDLLLFDKVIVFDHYKKKII